MGNIINVQPVPSSRITLHVTIPSTGWSSTATGGYYTNTVSLSSAISTAALPFISLTGSDLNTEATSAESAAFNLVNLFSFPDGSAVTQMTAKAKTKPTTTFYVAVTGDT